MAFMCPTLTLPLHFSRFPYSFPGGYTDPKLTRIPAAEMFPESPNTCPMPNRVPRSYPNNKRTIMRACRAASRDLQHYPPLPHSTVLPHRN